MLGYRVIPDLRRYVDPLAHPTAKAVGFRESFSVTEPPASITLLSICLPINMFFLQDNCAWSGTPDCGSKALSDLKRSWCRWLHRWAVVRGE